MSVLLVYEDREYLCARGSELQTDLGVLEIPPDVNPGETLETHLGTEFTVRRLRGPDLFNHLERTGAPMMPRDIGLIVGETGIETADRILDAGTGTGVLAAYLGRFGAEVVTYEQDPEFAETARENMALAGVDDRVTVRTGDITAAVDELDGFDVVTLDTEDAPAVVRQVPELVVPGGFVAVYSPFVEHTRSVAEAAEAADLNSIETIETIQRRMDFDERGSRPQTAGVGHTGYLTFARHD
ncbi:MAG: tRNA (adenine-N1)-methyltransferase [Halobacteriales archaeon]|nr:tRNA (adenine-N1)-methyltransferase [Halobacteriales archaeon]